MDFIWKFILFSFVVVSFEAKWIKQHIQPYFLHKNFMYYVTKFYMDAGDGYLTLFYDNHLKPQNATTTDNPEEFQRLSVVLVEAEKWEIFTETECANAVEKLSHSRHDFILNSANQRKQIDMIITQNQPQLYYIYLTDCGQTWKPEKEFNIFQFIDIGLILRNTDGSQFSLEDQQMKLPCILTMLCMLIFIAFNLRNLLEIRKKQEMVDYPFLIIIIALFLEFLSLGFQLINLIYYEKYGSWHFACNFAQPFLEAGANFLFTVVFALVAWGWTVNFMDITNFDLFLPVLAIAGAANIILVILSRLLNEKDEKPIFEGLPLLNYIYLIYKIGFFIFFVFGVIRTYGLARIKIKEFVVRFITLGILFFVSYGVLILIAEFLPLYTKKKFLLIGNEILNMIITLMLMKVFNSKVFTELSIRGKVVLPQDNMEIPKLF